jgi:cytochrome c553
MNYRNKKILELARDVPCQSCGAMDGTVVACHSDQLRDAKGTGIKSHDFRVAYMCNRCHHEQGNGNKLNRQEKIEMWEEAHRKTIGWLFLNEHITIR